MKPIKLTEEAKREALARFQKSMEDYTGDCDLTVKITADSLIADFDKIEKPTVYLTSEAYIQINLLVAQSSNELAWHGVVEKVNNDYLISRILVYPQTVTGVTVDANEEEYAKWLMTLNDDVINHLRFQGHSHVNMATSPSGRDTGNWQKFLNILKKDEFYIFCIANKKGEFYWNIFDIEKNIIFENKDITMCVVDNAGNNLKVWATESIEKYIKAPPKTGYLYQQQVITPHSFTEIDDTFKCTRKPFSDAIPPELLARGVSYEPDFDLYYADHYVPKFRYDNTWGCYTMEGEECRKQFGGQKPKGKPGRPKKKETVTSKKGG